jgi:hypothetical protein
MTAADSGDFILNLGGALGVPACWHMVVMLPAATQFGVPAVEPYRFAFGAPAYGNVFPGVTQPPQWSTLACVFVPFPLAHQGQPAKRYRGTWRQLCLHWSAWWWLPSGP